MAHERVLAGAGLHVPHADTGVQGAGDHVHPVKLGGGVGGGGGGGVEVQMQVGVEVWNPHCG